MRLAVWTAILLATVATPTGARVRPYLVAEAGAERRQTLADHER